MCLIFQQRLGRHRTETGGRNATETPGRIRTEMGGRHEPKRAGCGSAFMNQSLYITTSIPYVNSRPHVGHAQEFIIADCIARIYRSNGHHVTFQTGTDENAFKNVVAASRAGIPTQEFVDRNAEVFRQLIQGLNISADTFIRTTDPKHHKGVRDSHPVSIEKIVKSGTRISSEALNSSEPGPEPRERQLPRPSWFM